MNTEKQVFIAPKIIAHRGASAYAPENTLSAFNLAKKMGAEWVEFDVKLAKCQTPIVFHDESLERVTNAAGFVWDFTFEELKQLHVKNDNGQVTCCIPSLEEVIVCLSKNGLSANIEIKPNPGEEILTTKIIMNLLEKHWPVSLPPPLISSFDTCSLITAYELNPNINYACLMHEWDEAIIALAHDIHAVSINMNFHLLNSERLQYIQSQGFKVLAYTVNDSVLANDLFTLGVDGIFSDYPELLTR